MQSLVRGGDCVGQENTHSRLLPFKIPSELLLVGNVIRLVKVFVLTDFIDDTTDTILMLQRLTVLKTNGSSHNHKPSLRG